MRFTGQKMQPICNRPVGIVHADARAERYGILKKQRGNCYANCIIIAWLSTIS